eukprot:1333389-Amorphochlora_amoeboformis.AAC.1
MLTYWVTLDASSRVIDSQKLVRFDNVGGRELDAEQGHGHDLDFFLSLSHANHTPAATLSDRTIHLCSIRTP